MLWNIAINDAGADYDPLTLLRSRTMFGRPDWMSIYGRIKQAIEAGQYIPGTSAQLKTRVSVSIEHDCLVQGLMRCLNPDVLLWPPRAREGHQGGDSSFHQCNCAVRLCQGRSQILSQIVSCLISSVQEHF